MVAPRGGNQHWGSIMMYEHIIRNSPCPKVLTSKQTKQKRGLSQITQINGRALKRTQVPWCLATAPPTGFKSFILVLHTGDNIIQREQPLSSGEKESRWFLWAVDQARIHYILLPFLNRSPFWISMYWLFRSTDENMPGGEACLCYRRKAGNAFHFPPICMRKSCVL